MNAIISLCHFCDVHGPRTLFCTQAFKYTNTSNCELKQQTSSSSSNATTTKLSNESYCKACRAFDNNYVHYISYDNDAHSKLCYISQSQPSDSEVFSLVRKACLRTLHCEEFEDPIYFDDDKNGSVIGYEFLIKDSEGRGFHRSYSLIIIMKDRIYLQHLWSFLQHHLIQIAQQIKQAAQKLFDKEVRENSLNILNSPALSVVSQRSRDPVSRKKSNRSNRGLIELTNDTLIFAKLHMWFTWILRASACQISEEFLYGPLAEDNQIRLEEIKDSSNGDERTHENDDVNYCNSLLMESTHHQDLIGESDAYLLEINDYKTLIRKINFENFHALVYHVLVGNQIMIRCKYRVLVSSILRLLEQLIPYGCRRIVYYSNEYINSYKCNLLGLSNIVDPMQIDVHNSNDYFLLDLQLFKSAVKYDDPIDNYLFKTCIKTNTIFPLQSHLVPNVQLKIEGFILNADLDFISICSLISWIREEWLNKAKVWYKFSRAVIHASNMDIQNILQILKLEKKDELSLKFWQMGLSNECRLQLRSS